MGPGSLPPDFCFSLFHIHDLTANAWLAFPTLESVLHRLAISPQRLRTQCDLARQARRLGEMKNTFCSVGLLTGLLSKGRPMMGQHTELIGIENPVSL